MARGSYRGLVRAQDTRAGLWMFQTPRLARKPGDSAEGGANLGEPRTAERRRRLRLAPGRPASTAPGGGEHHVPATARRYLASLAHAVASRRPRWIRPWRMSSSPTPCRVQRPALRTVQASIGCPTGAYSGRLGHPFRQHPGTRSGGTPPRSERSDGSPDRDRSAATGSGSLGSHLSGEGTLG